MLPSSETTLKVKSEKRTVVKRSVQSGFCIEGDLILDFNAQTYHHTWHQYHQIARKEFHKQHQILEIQLTKKKPIDKKIAIIVDMLGNSMDEQSREFCAVLQRYQAIVAQYTLIFKQISLLLQNPQTSSIINKDLSDLRLGFHEQLKQVFTCKSDFFFYTITSNNYNEGVQEKTKLGYSNKLMMLLARSVDNFEHIYLKERAVTIQILCHDANNAFCAKYGIMRGFFKDSVVCLYFPKIEQSHLDLLYKARKNSKSSSLAASSSSSSASQSSMKQHQSDTSSMSSAQDSMNSMHHKPANEIISKFYTQDPSKQDEQEMLARMQQQVLLKQRRHFSSQSQAATTSDQIKDNNPHFLN